MRWKAWYAGPISYDSNQYAWSDLPSIGIQVLIVFHNDYTYTFYDGADWYWYYDNKFGYAASGDWGTNKEKPIDVVPCVSCIKQGVGLPFEEFLVIQKTARADAEKIQKAAWGK